MGFFDRLAFWRKKEPELGGDILGGNLGMGNPEAALGGRDFGLGQDFDAGRDLGIPSYEGPAAPAQDYPQMQQQFMKPSQQQTAPYGFQQAPVQLQTPQQDIISKNMEVISSKLDALRANLESINQRLANIERIASGEQEDKRRRW